ncbi:hypothetical protein BASA50_009794 [Batrachochytrium salamandrivorans]|uniref:Uncharacterized protein n=1 Tax=Batrachochytrium salamandrivorans TaxID=1357716 RepID=A0ABQ8F0E2_9FUNG|nr:hypothetical protein BASA50_009794 [Batrachochytrium salamandrivorans]
MLWSMPSMVGTAQAPGILNKSSSMVNQVINDPSSITNQLPDRGSSLFNQIINSGSSLLNQVLNRGSSLFNQVSESWQQGGGSAFQSYQQQSSYTPALSSSDQCGKIADDNGIIPFRTWGRMTEPMKIAWGQQGCDQQMCQYWTKKYGIRPFETGGSIPSSLNSAWEHKQMECNYRVGPYSIAQCKYAADRFNAGPLGIWGTMPDYARTFWTQGNCDVKMCGIWKDKYGVIKGQTYGSMPDGFKRMWDDPRLSCTDKI